MTDCPCGSTKKFSDCCEVFLTGAALPPSPETLMRSRYTAYTLGRLDYIAKTMASPALDRFNQIEAHDWVQAVEWDRLEVLKATPYTTKGFVEFMAHFHQNKTRHVMHEISEFHLIDGQWFYVDGIEPRGKAASPLDKVKRNDACLCGSGRKYKKCCGNLA